MVTLVRSHISVGFIDMVYDENIESPELRLMEAFAARGKAYQARSAKH